MVRFSHFIIAALTMGLLSCLNPPPSPPRAIPRPTPYATPVIPPRATAVATQTPLPRGNGQSLEDGLATLAQRITETMNTEGRQKIAIVPFTDLEGEVSELGKFLSEELITRLFGKGQFQVVERLMLDRVMQEHRLVIDGLIDPQTAKELGRLLGADAICSGTIADLSTSVKINGRLISTETGSLLAVASAEIVKDETLRRLMGQGNEPVTSGQSNRQGITRAGGVVFSEDFSGIEEGFAPEGWVGAEHLMVRRGQTGKHLRRYEVKDTRIVIPNLSIPENFKFEWQGRYQWAFGVTPLVMDVGGVRASFGFERGTRRAFARINNQGREFSLSSNVTHIVALEKRGEIFRLFVDGQEIVFARINAYRPGTSVILDFGKGDFELDRISLYAL